MSTSQMLTSVLPGNWEMNFDRRTCGRANTVGSMAVKHAASVRIVDRVGRIL